MTDTSALTDPNQPTRPRVRRSAEPEPTYALDFILPKRDLVATIARVAGVTEAKSPMPMLGMTLIRAEGTRLRASATDLYAAIDVSTDALVTRPGAVCVSGKDLLERAKAMPEGPVRFSATDLGVVDVRSSSSKLAFRMKGMNAKDYPQLPSVAPGTRPALSMPATEFATLVRRVAYSVDLDETRPHLSAMHVYARAGRLVFDSTTGKSLARAVVPHDGTFDWLLSRKSVLQLLAVLTDGQVEIAHVDPYVFVTIGATTLAIKTVNATHPPCDQVIPASQPGRLVVARKALTDTVKAVSVAADAATGYVDFTIEGGMLTVSASDESGDASDELPVEKDGPDARFGFNSAKTLETLGQLSGEQVDFGFEGDNQYGVCTFRALGDVTGSVAILMPMRSDFNPVAATPRDGAKPDAKAKPPAKEKAPRKKKGKDAPAPATNGAPATNVDDDDDALDHDVEEAD